MFGITCAEIAKAANGDNEAIDTIFGECAPRLSGYLRHILNDAHHVEDVLQEAFVALLRRSECHAATGDGVAAWFGPCLWRIARNLAISKLRRIRIEPVRMGADMENRASGDSDPGSLAETSDRRETIRAIVAEIPDKPRDVFVLRQYSEMTYPEIAEILERPLGTVKTQMREALAFLRPRLERALGGEL